MIIIIIIINKNYRNKEVFGYHDALKIYEAPKLCTETTLSNQPVVIFWVKYQKLLKVEIIWIPFSYILEKINKNYDRKTLFGYHDASKIYGAPKLCTVM